MGLTNGGIVTSCESKLPATAPELDEEVDDVEKVEELDDICSKPEILESE